MHLSSRMEFSIYTPLSRDVTMFYHHNKTAKSQRQLVGPFQRYEVDEIDRNEKKRSHCSGDICRTENIPAMNDI